ncbi:MAG TPA: hypothetical protein V6D02_00975 [Candidatus Obscuribacterales bacterium]
MRIFQEIKVSRLVLAVAVTLLVADTIPHPNLAAGVVESSLSRVSTVNAGSPPIAESQP